MNNLKSVTSKLFLVGSLLVVFGCDASEKPIEDELYTCLVQHYADNEVDLPVYLDSLEDYLIREGILTSKSGEGKIEYYRKIIESGQFHYAPQTDFMIILADSYIVNGELVKCLKTKPTFDSLVYYTSEFHLTSQKITEHVTSSGAVNPANVSKAIVANLSANDMDHPFYRAHMLISFVMANDRKKAYIENLPEKVASPYYPESTGFTIDIGTPDIFLVNNQSIQKDKIEARILSYLEDFNENSHIRFVVSSSTLYQHFAEVHNIITNAYKKRWDQAARKELNAPFDQLSTDQQQYIKEKYPSRIVEVLPK
jgi:hypothetical protein